MATVIETSPIQAVTDTLQDDPFRYGWRHVPHTLPNGDEILEQVPLTLEDILHPQVGDFRLHSQDHERFCIYLHDVFEAHVANDPTTVVLHDVRVAWADPDIQPHGPDIAVIFGVSNQRNWSTFDETEEGTKPSLIIEVTSPNTRSTDLVDKLDHYEQVGVQLYIIIDTYLRKGTETRRLLGYQLTPNGYNVLPPDERGWLWLEPVGLWLGLRDNEPECYDETGRPIKGYTDLTIAYVEAENRATNEEQARIKAEARLRQLEAELHRLQQKDK